MLQTVINGDCLEVISSFQEKSIDVIITSPPYNIGKKYNTYSDNLKKQEYLNWLEKVFLELKRVLKDNGSFFLNVGSTCRDPYIKYEVLNVCRNHFVLQNDIIWAKSLTLDGKTHGHFKPVISDRFLNIQHESIFHLTKNGDVKIDRLANGVPYVHKYNIGRWKHNGKTEQEAKSDLKCGGNIWHVPYQTSHGQKSHPAGFPVLLPEKCIKMHGLNSDLVVLDPFLGSGTTLICCKKLNIKGIGIELDQEYCKIAESNLE